MYSLMAKKKKIIRPKARLPKGLIDVTATQSRAMRGMIDDIREIYEIYGFEPLETPAFEYSDALGKFLPDQDRPNEGVYSFEDEDGQWLSLRYDLTAPLARFVAENYDSLPKPFRRYQTGPVWRNEKPGPGRYRQFTQFDADTVGTDNLVADAEMLMLASDCLEKLGIPRGSYQIRVNNRKVLDGVLEKIEISSEPDDISKKLTVLRAIDKLDRLGTEGVEKLLGDGRKDESGDFTKGAGLSAGHIQTVLDFVNAGDRAQDKTITNLEKLVQGSEIGTEGVRELQTIADTVGAAGFDTDRIAVDPSIVRGLDYYTGPVFEAELTFEREDDDGNAIRFGSVGGGGRYDGLVARFKGTTIPATGFSIGVSRLFAALDSLGKINTDQADGPVIVLVMDQDRTSEYQKIVGQLRSSGIKAEMYTGTSGMRAQMKYADKRNAPCVIIQGEDEREKGEVMIKDLLQGAKLSEEITDNKEWREGRPAQFAVPQNDIVAEVGKTLIRQKEDTQ